MKPDEFARLKEIIFEAANLPEEERKAYLDEACKGNPKLRKEAEAVFAHESDRHEILKIGGAIPFEQEVSSEPPDMIGCTLSHFHIEEKIASGGMGVLYKATDLKLDRSVAIKALKPDLLSHSDIRERFVREAKAASSLNHPGIVTVYEIDSDLGIDFIAMEYVEGETLDEQLSREGMPIESVTGYALQIAEALQVAHEKGIVHRDLKPSNIMITGANKAKILDFGIAKQLYSATGGKAEASPDTQITQLGGVIGTLRYLSPEQASGENVDHRTDIWSLGVMLYEMVSGRVPFAGKDKTALIGAILKETPLPVSEHRSGVPEVLEEIIKKCLEKDREERYQSVDELASDLLALRQAMATGTTTGWSLATKKSKGWMGRWWPWVASIAVIAMIAVAFLIRNFIPFGEPPDYQRNMIVVLPFENLGPTEDEYFADGITEELIARLASIGELGVIARTSAMNYKATEKTIRQIGEELGVDYVLEGTIRWQRADGESRVRVTPQLIRVSDEIHLWAEIYDMDMTDIFQVQSEIALQVAENLDITLLGSEREVIETIPTDNPDAYQAYLRGQDYCSRANFASSDFSEESHFMAEKMFEHAIELDSTFALAYAALSRYHFLTYFNYHDRTETRLRMLLETAKRALELNPDLPEGHQAMGQYYFAVRDYNRALEYFRVACEIRPNFSPAIYWTAIGQECLGNFEAGLEGLKRVSELSPESIGTLFSIALAYIRLRDYPKADAYYSRILSLRPDLASAYIDKAWVYILWKGDTGKAREILEQWPGDPEEIAQFAANLDYYDRKYTSYLDRLTSTESEVSQSQVQFTPYSLDIAEVYYVMDQNELARAYADSARVLLESELEKRPDDCRILGSLGLAYAYLGLKDEAIQMGVRAVQALPVSQDAMRGFYPLVDLAVIYTIVGEHDAAIDQLEYLLSIPGYLSVSQLRILPIYDPLRDHPRFQKLIAEG